MMGENVTVLVCGVREVSPPDFWLPNACSTRVERRQNDAFGNQRDVVCYDLDGLWEKATGGTSAIPSVIVDSEEISLMKISN